MANLTRNSWTDGWCPSDDSVNGRRSGLLRADNLTQDEVGSLSLVKGTKVLAGPFSAPVMNVSSRYFDNSKFQFIHLANGSVVTQTGMGILEGGNSNRCVFHHSFGNEMIFSGSKKVRFDGGSVYDIGVKKPSQGPWVNGFSPPFIWISNFSDWQLDTGSDDEVGEADFQFSTSDNFGIIYSTAARDFSKIGGYDGTPEDIFSFLAQVGDTSLLERIRVDIYLDGDLTNPGDYFHYEWLKDSENSAITQGINVFSKLSAKRSDFVREGGNAEKNWSTVTCIKITFVVTAQIENCLVCDMRFTGGALGPLNGNYQYAQVNVKRDYNSAYIACSQMSEPSGTMQIVNGYAHISPIVDSSDVDEIWIYRRSADYNADVIELTASPKLDQWYRIKVLEHSGTEFDDKLSDVDALLAGETFSEQALSLYDLEDEIIGAAGPINGRNIYLTIGEVIISEELSPETYLPIQSIRLSGDRTEKNLWIAKVSNSLILIGTSADIYELEGTFRDNPDYTIDIVVRALGSQNFPPISKDHFVYNNAVYYMAVDGWRVVNGSQNEKISSNLDELFTGKTCYGIPPVAIVPNNNGCYPVAVYNNKLWGFPAFQDGTRRGTIFDFKFKCWEYLYLDPICLFVEEDNNLIAGFGGGSGNYLRQLNIGTLLDESTGQDVTFLTVFDDNNEPRNRKDAFTLKLTLDTGNTNVNIQIAKDKGSFYDLGNHAFNGVSEFLIDLANTIGIGFRYALKITGTALPTFKIVNYTIEYSPFPEQLNHYVIPYTNLGTLSRKRFTAFAFVIDPLGNTITFTPRIDGTSKTAESFTFNRKGTYIYYFRTDEVGTDIGGVITGGTFEYYSLNLEECVSEKLPSPTKYLLIPANDYGNPNRKRHSSYKFQINTRGAQVRFTPRLDGVDKTPMDFETAEKSTVEYFFTVDTIAIDIGGTLESLEDTPFEFYGVIRPQEIEVLPPRLKEFYIPNTDYGEPNRKRHSSYKFQINTNGELVRFTPRLDNINGTPMDFSTDGKEIVEYYFSIDTFAKEIGGELVSLADTAFEYYGVIKPQKIEVMPPRLKEFRIPENNFGVPSKKRIRTIPLVLNTNGYDVVFTPYVDQVAYPPTTFNTPSRQTVFHYFTTDVFGIDASGELIGTEPFEFDGMLTPIDVEVIPVGKKFDQIGPYEIPRIGKLLSFRIRCIATGTTLPYTIFSEDEDVYSNVIDTIPNKDKVYEVMQIPKTIAGTVFRIEFGPADVFHRYYVDLKFNASGMNTDTKWQRVK